MKESIEVKRIHLCMGMQCNVRCSMCYQSDFSGKFNMSPSIYRDSLRNILPSLEIIKFEGGEANIMDNCRDLVSFLDDYDHIKISTSTNGVILSNFMKQAILKKGQDINFSINAASQKVYDQIVKHGNFERVLKNIDTLVQGRLNGQNYPSISISMVVLNNNILELSNFVDLAQNLGVDKVKFIIDGYLTYKTQHSKGKIREAILAAHHAVARTNLAVEGLDALSRGYGISVENLSLYNNDAVIQKNTCLSPFQNLWIDSDGSVRVCPNTWITIGSLKKNDISHILTGSTRKRFQQKVKDGDYSWCKPDCPNNIAPSRTALLRKYLHIACEDPLNLLRKLNRKLAAERRSELSGQGGDMN